MNTAQRRTEILKLLQQEEKPVAARAMASQFGVSRQVIVQDIALIRAAGYDILSTNRGYILQTPATVSRVFKVNHTDEQLEEELCSIVDMGGCVENVMINHRVYGHMEAELHINSRRKVMEFIGDIKSGKSSPLKNITSNYHYHLIEADSEETLDLIEQVLKEKDYLVSNTP